MVRHCDPRLFVPGCWLLPQSPPRLGNWISDCKPETKGLTDRIRLDKESIKGLGVVNCIGSEIVFLALLWGLFLCG